jgi:hypothetical protein
MAEEDRKEGELIIRCCMSCGAKSARTDGDVRVKMEVRGARAVA